MTLKSQIEYQYGPVFVIWELLFYPLNDGNNHTLIVFESFWVQVHKYVYHTIEVHGHHCMCYK